MARGWDPGEARWPNFPTSDIINSYGLGDACQSCCHGDYRLPLFRGYEYLGILSARAAVEGSPGQCASAD